MNRMLTFEAQGIDVAYEKLFMFVKEEGCRYGPRGKSCVEIRPAHVTLLSPEMGLYSGSSRRLNYSFFAVETLCYLAGWGGPRQAQLILASNKNMLFAMNKTTFAFDGAYGTAFLETLNRVHKELSDNNDSRRGVISIWQHNQDMDSLDVPCTMSLHFFTEETTEGNRMLSLQVNMRSNDLNWGFPYDVAAFASIQVAMARSLGLTIGVYYHSVGSLHYYETGNSEGERPPKIVRIEMEKFDDTGILTIPVPPNRMNIDTISTVASHILNDMVKHVNDGGLINSFTCATDKIPCELHAYFNAWQQLWQWSWKGR